MICSDHINKLQLIILYKFKNKKFISIALCHPGAKKQHNKIFAREFERLEFLGDRVLGLSLSDFLYKNFSSDSEGDLSVRMSSLAGTDFLIYIAKKTKIIDCFSVPKDCFVSPDKNSSSIADMVEAVCGAVFLYSNFETTQRVILQLWGEDVENILHKQKDAKTRLQEVLQSKNMQLPAYQLVHISGEAHNPVFEIKVQVCDYLAVGYGHSKKNAEHDAAENMLKLLYMRGVVDTE